MKGIALDVILRSDNPHHPIPIFFFFFVTSCCTALSLCGYKMSRFLCDANVANSHQGLTTAALFNYFVTIILRAILCPCVLIVYIVLPLLTVRPDIWNRVSWRKRPYKLHIMISERNQAQTCEVLNSKKIRHSQGVIEEVNQHHTKDH